MAVEAHLTDVTNVIRLAVAPVFMLTAVGTIIAALNLRLGRSVDRRRALESQLASLSGADAQSARDELAQTEGRIRFAYYAILAAVLSALLVCLLIAAAFVGAFVALDLSRMIGVLFVLAMLALIVSLLLFLREVFMAVTSPRHVAGAAGGRAPPA
jgi:hypothetical protein